MTLRSLERVCTAVALGVVVAAPCVAQPPGVPDEVLTVPRLSTPIKIDGTVTEAEWEGVPPVPLPWEVSPGHNLPAIVDTECRIAYDAKAVYLGCVAHDPDPAAIRAHLTDRDKAWRDDYIGLMLDTFNDERRAFGFYVNPLGVQIDVIRNDVSGSNEYWKDLDSSWDAIWASKGRITDQGYEIEMAIPFTSLRFQRGNGAQTWGMLIYRNYPRSVRRQFGNAPVDRGRNCVVCQAAKITGFEGATPGKNLELNPTLTARRIDDREQIPDGGFRVREEGGELGLTALWGITPNLTFAGAINPDFSHVEADAAKLDVNRQFAIFFEEKRPFFLEGSDFFETQFDTVHTRNVVDPEWGAKLTGKEGRGAIGAFVAEDAVTNVLIPGSERSFLVPLDGNSLDAVARYRRDLGAASTLGVLYTGREGDDYSNHMAGIDGLFRFSTRDSIKVQILGSQTEYPDDVAAWFGQPQGSFDDLAYRLGYSYQSRDLSWGLQYEDVGESFRADMGFMPQVDYRQYGGGFNRNWWGKPQQWHTSIYLGGRFGKTEKQDGELLYRGGRLWAGFQGPLQTDVMYEVSVRKRGFAGEQFDQTAHDVFFQIRPSGVFDFYTRVRWGDDIDYAHVRPGTKLNVSTWSTLRIGRHLQLIFSHEYEQLDVDLGRLFDVNLSELKVVYQFSARTFVRAILQYEELRRDPELYEHEVAPNREDLFTQLLFSYKINPKTVLFLGYSDNHLGTESVDLTQLNRTAFLKVGYAWVW
jgi:hypothetical protein